VRRKRARANSYAAVLIVDSYSEQARDALRDGDDVHGLSADVLEIEEVPFGHGGQFFCGSAFVSRCLDPSPY
jgi:hypothetical protein